MPLKTENKSALHEKFFLFRIFQEIFLPKGYPDSVSEDYAAYQIWDTIQAFCSTICGMLITKFFFSKLQCKITKTTKTTKNLLCRDKYKCFQF